jgi:hypothetical protein
MTVGAFLPRPEGRDRQAFQPEKWHNEHYAPNSLTNGVYVGETPAEIAANCTEEWQQHFERRMQLFFLQLISVWKTPYEFEWKKAESQYGKGSRDQDTVGAHSSTLPCLVAYHRGIEPRPQGVVYLKHAHSYIQHNATVVLPKFFNDADSEIDGNLLKSALRNAALEIINDVAACKYGVREGMKKYLASTEEAIESAFGSAKKAPTIVALELYKGHLATLRWHMENDPGYYDQLIGVKIGNGDRANVIRDVVFASRFKLIQDCETIESEIARKILNAQNIMLGQTKQALDKIDYRLRYVLLDEPDTQYRRALEKLFCTSIDQLRMGVDRSRAISSFRDKEANRPVIASLKRDLRALIREMGNKELDYRSSLFRGLKERVHRWRHIDFVAQFKAKFPGEPMSTTMVSRLQQRTRAAYENRRYLTPLNQRRKNLDVAKAMKIAETFKVDAGLFLPAVVSSVYE